MVSDSKPYTVTQSQGNNWRFPSFIFTFTNLIEFSRYKDALHPTQS